MELKIRPSKAEDLEFLKTIESNSFAEFQRSSEDSLKRSLESNHQQVLIVEDEAKNPLAALLLYRFKRSLRIHSIAVKEEARNLGIGGFLLAHVIEMGKKQGKERIILEAHTKNDTLIQWYKSKGFEIVETLPSYYQKGEDAYKMEMWLDEAAKRRSIQNIIVVNLPNHWAFEHVNAKLISVKEYISNPIYQDNNDLRIFNLCNSYKYQSYGYYVSLLASARNQRVIPNSLTIGDFKQLNVIRSVTSDLEELIISTCDKLKGDRYELNVYFGQTKAKGFSQLAAKLYQIIEAPLFQVQFVKAESWMIKSMKVLNLNQLPQTEYSDIQLFAKKYFDKKRFRKYKSKPTKYDLAVLIDPAEKTPPSTKEALKSLQKAANRKGMGFDFIQTKDFDRINEFDALFIRQTTNVNNDTYKISRLAFAEGLVVIDDPWSILKCSNKIYQNELFRTHKIKTPQTTVLSKNLFNKALLDDLKYPLVLKQPDSAFSLGVIKVENREEAQNALKKLFKGSDMVLCQEFLFSDYDWRIGILDNQALFACKYYMSSGHWQIYNWKEGTEEDHSGDHETLPISAVPKTIVETALKAASFFGDGLYGVDLKLVNGQAYVIEVNDNPNIDDGVEDAYLKDALYDKIIDSIYRRIESSRNIISQG